MAIINISYFCEILAGTNDLEVNAKWVNMFISTYIQVQNGVSVYTVNQVNFAARLFPHEMNIIANWCQFDLQNLDLYIVIKVKFSILCNFNYSNLDLLQKLHNFNFAT